VAQTAIIAATQAVKRTADLIPFCHPLPVEGCSVEISDTDDGLELRCEVRTTSRTGVEMEAWTGASVGALTIVDMCKALSPAIRVEGLRLVSKSGGKRDYREDPA
jgi:cyclic pyranopterin phosphate synthase